MILKYELWMNGKIESTSLGAFFKHRIIECYVLNDFSPILTLNWPLSMMSIYPLCTWGDVSGKTVTHILLSLFFLGSGRCPLQGCGVQVGGGTLASEKHIAVLPRKLTAKSGLLSVRMPSFPKMYFPVNDLSPLPVLVLSSLPRH